jgi:hypothetical protein
MPILPLGVIGNSVTTPLPSISNHGLKVIAVSIGKH